MWAFGRKIEPGIPALEKARKLCRSRRTGRAQGQRPCGRRDADERRERRGGLPVGSGVHVAVRGAAVRGRNSCVAPNEGRPAGASGNHPRRSVLLVETQLHNHGHRTRSPALRRPPQPPSESRRRHSHAQTKTARRFPGGRLSKTVALSTVRRPAEGPRRSGASHRPWRSTSPAFGQPIRGRPGRRPGPRPPRPNRGSGRRPGPRSRRRSP